MVIGASTEEPVIFALAVFDRQVVDAGDPPSHQALFVELPILVAIAAKPVAAIVVPLICKAHGYPVVAKRPDLFDQPILQLASPLAYEECFDGLSATNELGAVAPDAIQRIGKSYFGRIARVPASSARRAFCVAVSAVNGGSGGRSIFSSRMSVPKWIVIDRRQGVSARDSATRKSCADPESHFTAENP